MKPKTANGSKEHDRQYPNFAATFLDSATFDQKQYAHDWLIEQIFVRGQPAVVGGPKKALKTSIVVDMAISLGTGRPFLGKFKVAKPRRAAVISGESGAATLQETGASEAGGGKSR